MTIHTDTVVERQMVERALRCLSQSYMKEADLRRHPWGVPKPESAKFIEVSEALAQNCLDMSDQIEGPA